MTTKPARNGLERLAALGQSPWYDNLAREWLPDGLARLIEQEALHGVTSNPAIFRKAMSESPAYADELERCVVDNGVRDAEAMYETLAVTDIRAAADTLRSVHERTDGADGFVSLEVSPALAHDADGTVRDARRLARRIDRPNVMIKVPGTEAGLVALETLIAEGIPVNVTLLFGLARYRAVADAYCRALEARLARGEHLQVASVASFFVSRLDGPVDAALDAGADAATRGRLRAMTGIHNARCAYAHYRQRFNRDGAFRDLAAAGARPQRLLWASTGVKDPALPETWYVDALAGPETVTTLPPATWEACRDHEPASGLLDSDPAADFARLDEAGAWIDGGLDGLTARLEDEGIAAFETAYQGLLEAIGQRIAERFGKGVQPHVG